MKERLVETIDLDRAVESKSYYFKDVIIKIKEVNFNTGVKKSDFKM